MEIPPNLLLLLLIEVEIVGLVGLKSGEYLVRSVGTCEVNTTRVQVCMFIVSASKQSKAFEIYQQKMSWKNEKNASWYLWEDWLHELEHLLHEFWEQCFLHLGRRQ